MDSAIASAATPSSPGTSYHIGFVAASIANSVQGHTDSLQAEWAGVISHDLNQVVRVPLLPSRHGTSPLFELVEPAADKSPVIPFPKNGGGLHHLCYEVPNLEHELARCRSKGSLIARARCPPAIFKDAASPGFTPATSCFWSIWNGDN